MNPESYGIELEGDEDVAIGRRKHPSWYEAMIQRILKQVMEDEQGSNNVAQPMQQSPYRSGGRAVRKIIGLPLGGA